MAHRTTILLLAGPPSPPSKPPSLPGPQPLPAQRLSQQLPSRPSATATSPSSPLTSAPLLSRQEPIPASPSFQPTHKPPGTSAPRTSLPRKSSPPHPAPLLSKVPSAPAGTHGATGSTNTVKISSSFSDLCLYNPHRRQRKKRKESLKQRKSYVPRKRKQQAGLSKKSYYGIRTPAHWLHASSCWEMERR